jgi:SH3-like domain-containing protein
LFVLSILSKPYILLSGQWLHRKMLAIHIPQTFSQHKRLDLSGERCIIFVDTTREARTLLSHPALGHRAKAVHNESSPHDRDRTLTAFANLEPLVTFWCTLSYFRFGNLDHSTGFGIQSHHQIWAVYEESWRGASIFFCFLSRARLYVESWRGHTRIDRWGMSFVES